MLQLCQRYYKIFMNKLYLLFQFHTSVPDGVEEREGSYLNGYRFAWEGRKTSIVKKKNPSFG